VRLSLGDLEDAADLGISVKLALAKGVLMLFSNLLDLSLEVT